MNRGEIERELDNPRHLRTEGGNMEQSAKANGRKIDDLLDRRFCEKVKSRFSRVYHTTPLSSGQ